MKDKAKTLIEKFSTQTYNYQPYAGANWIEEEIGDECGKKCAILHVEGIIEEYELLAPAYKRKEFWQGVLNELKNM